jgi:hypothetical protein
MHPFKCSWSKCETKTPHPLGVGCTLIMTPWEKKPMVEKPVPVCASCGQLWSDCQGECIIEPSPHTDNPVLTEISKWAEEYVNKLEVELTEKACLCQWFYRDGAPKQIEVTSQQAMSEGKKEYLPGSTPRLRVRSHEHPECPVHTRRGLLVGFYQWATTEKDFIALWSVASALNVCADEERIEIEAEQAYQEGLNGEVGFSDEEDGSNEIERL